jgi:hypothetical protein
MQELPRNRLTPGFAGLLRDGARTDKRASRANA